MMLFPTTTALLDWMWQSTLCLGACWLLYQLLRHEPCFHYNRRFLLFTPWLALLLPVLLASAAPLLSSWLPSNEAPTILLTPSVTLPAMRIGSSVSASTLWWTWLPLVYGAGVLLWLARLGGQLVLLWLKTRRLPHEKREDFTVIQTSGRLPISSFGRLVFWDETAALTSAEATQILQHELVHVRQGHTQERLLLEVARAVLWFNPFVHFYSRALDLTHEFIADAAVLHGATPGAPTAYASLLARLTLRRLHPYLPLAHSFTQSQTLIRIAMLHSSRSARRWKQWLLLPVSAMLLFTFACEQAAEPNTPTAAATSADSKEAPPAPPVPSAGPSSPVAGVYQYVEEMPEYAGGMTQLLTDLMQQLRYPQAALAAEVEGRVFVSFVVDENGHVQAVKIQKGLTAPNASAAVIKEMNDASVAAVRNLPGKWTPGKQDGKVVSVSYTVPISFSLQQAKATLPDKSVVPITYPASPQQ